MVPLLVALAFQASTPAACARTALAAADSGWSAYRRGAMDDASVHFAVADSLCPGNHAAQVGLGFVRLRQNEPRAAAAEFLQAVRTDTADADAWYGLGLARSRLKDRAGAVRAWRSALALTPTYGDAELQILALGIDSGLVPAAAHRPADPDVPARTAGDGFEVRAPGGGGGHFM